MPYDSQGKMMTTQEFKILCQGRNCMQSGTLPISTDLTLPFLIFLDTLEHIFKLSELLPECIDKQATPQQKAKCATKNVYSIPLLKALYMPLTHKSDREVSKWIRIAE